MKFKEVFGNTFLLLSSIYLPLVFYSAFEYFSPSNLSRIMRDKILNEDIDQKIEAVKSGFIPTYLPNKLLGHKNKLKVYPIGSLPQEESYWCNEGYGLIKYKTDRFGLRNSEEKREFSKNESNIFVIGDSFINVACIKIDK